MNSFERERLGWIAFHEISSSQTVSLRDFGEYPQDAYRINIGPDEYFILENHQLNTPYDNPDQTGKKGLYIIRQFPYQSTPNEGNLKVETADGRFNWSVPEWAIHPGNNDIHPVFKRDDVNRALGLNDRDHFYAVHPVTGLQGIYYLIAKKDEVTGQNVFGAFYKGDGKDAFTLDFNNVFGTWSNPPTRLKSGALPSTNVGIEILPSSTSVLDIQFFIGNPQNGSPSKPTLGWYHIGPVQYGWIHLGWGANLWDNNPVDPDINWSELQRKIGIGPWVTVYSGSNRTWSDHSITYDPNGDTPVYFRVRWRDTQNKWSVWSDLFNTKMISIYYEQKTVAQNFPDEKPSVYDLKQNYPNPFNPITNIVYQLPQSGFVQLKVYDPLGREVAVLVNEVKLEGSYEVSFDASSLPSGVYICSLRVNDFIHNNKMTLLK